MKRLILFVITVVAFVVGFTMVYRIWVSEPAMVTLSGTAVYVDSSTFDADDDSDGAVCTPTTGGGSYNNNSIEVNTAAIWTGPSLHVGEVGSGTISNGNCVVEIDLLIPKTESLRVYFGAFCSSNHWSSYDVIRQAKNGDWSFGTQNVSDKCG